MRKLPKTEKSARDYAFLQWYQDGVDHKPSFENRFLHPVLRRRWCAGYLKSVNGLRCGLPPEKMEELRMKAVMPDWP